MTPSEKKQLADLIGQYLEPLGLYLIDILVRAEGRVRVVEVYIDSDKGVTADQCGEVSRRITPVLDAVASLKGEYTLTVSSPGLDRPLKFSRQYVKHKGRTLVIQWKSAEGIKKLEAGLEDATETTITVRTDRDEKVTIPFDAIMEARVKPRW